MSKSLDAGFRIVSSPRYSVPDLEHARVPQFHPPRLGQRLNNCIEHLLDDFPRNKLCRFSFISDGKNDFLSCFNRRERSEILQKYSTAKPEKVTLASIRSQKRPAAIESRRALNIIFSQVSVSTSDNPQFGQFLAAHVK